MRALFTREGAATVSKETAGTALEGRVTTAAARFSLADLQEQADAYLERLRPVHEFDLTIDLFSNTIVIEVDNKPDRDRLAAQVQEPATVRVVTELSRPAANIYAGLAISCTTGFSVISGTTKGISTAGHCPDSQSYAGTTLPRKAEKLTTSYDVQWHSAPGLTVQPWANDGDGQVRYINGKVARSSQALNTYLCKYGVSTGFDCGYIVANNFAPSWVPGASATFMRLYSAEGHDMASSGDSGGPVYSLTKAYGLISGSYGSNNVDQAVYMAANYIETGVGVTILTAP